MSAAYGPGPDVGVTLSHDGTSVYLAHLPDGPLVVLEGVAALIWQEATAAPASGWVGRVATAVGESEEHIGADVDAFVTDLRARHLLAPLPTGRTGAPGTSPR